MTQVLVIAGTASGVGKTSLTLGIARALRNRGLRVLAAKVGPDYLDPQQLSRATGRPCMNLDAFMMGKPYVVDWVSRAARDVDLILVEGVMGLFDGVEPHDNHGSTAEMADWLSANVVLVAEARAQARSFAAAIQGFVNFPMGKHIVGVIANRVGGAPHAQLLSSALTSVGLPALLSYVPEGAMPDLPSRHLGLIAPENDAALEALAAAVEQYVPLEKLLALATPIPQKANAAPPAAPSSLRLAVAEDEAFSFVYADLRQTLEARGVSWLPCSPLRDARVPDDAQALYLPGGYPEEHGQALAENRAFMNSLRSFAQRRPIYAECGGLMLLTRALVDRNGRTHELAGILPGQTTMRDRIARLGYAEVTLLQDSLWGSKGDQCRGHEFHFSDLKLNEHGSSDWQQVYQVDYRGGLRTLEGYQKGRVLASYVHLHFASRPKALSRWLEALAAP